MKRILLIITLLIFSLSYGQKQKVEVLRYKQVTTVERDAFTVPAGEFWRIYNTTTSQHEFWDGDSWEILGFQDLSALALKSNVLELDNTDIFTPTLDYHPSTKKYVDDNTGASPLTTKGDLFGYSTVDARLPVGINDQVLTADSAQPLGVKWADSGGGGVEYQDYTFDGWVDSSTGNTWILVSPFYLGEYSQNTGVLNTASMTTVSVATIDNTAHLRAWANQTVQDFKIICSGNNYDHIKGVSIMKANITGTTLNSATILYENNNISLTQDTIFTIPSGSFSETSISAGDIPIIAIYVNTADDVTFTNFRLRTTID